MRDLSLRSLAKWMALASAIMACAYLVASMFVYGLIDRTDRQLLLYEDQATPEVIAFSNLIDRMGYGSLIHNYKNYLLRGGAERLRVFDMSAGASLANIARLRVQLGPEWHDDLAVVEANIREYMNQIEVIARVRALDDNIEGIDSEVYVEDGPALAALAHLRAEIIQSGEPTRQRLIFELHHALGFGQLIHNFKNYVIRKETRYAVAAQASADQVIAIIADYRQFDLSEDERLALDAIATTVRQYRANIDVVRRMASEGASASDIDEVVQIPDGPALAGLDTLAIAAQEQIERSQSQLHRAMIFLKSGAIFMAMVVFLAMAAFSYALWFIMEHVILAPAEQIANGLNRMAHGDMRVDLSAYSSRNEIGRIADASRAFKNSLRDNRRLSEHQKNQLVELQRLSREVEHLDEDQKTLHRERRADMQEHRKERDHREALNRSLESVMASARKGDFSNRILRAFDEPDLQNTADQVNALMESLAATFGAEAQVRGATDLPEKHDEMIGNLSQMRAEVQRTLSSLDTALETAKSSQSGRSASDEA